VAGLDFLQRWWSLSWPGPFPLDAGGPLLMLAFGLGFGVAFLFVAWLVEAAGAVITLGLSKRRSLGLSLAANLASTLVGFEVMVVLFWQTRPLMLSFVWCFLLGISVLVEAPIWWVGTRKEGVSPGRVVVMVVGLNGVSYLLGALGMSLLSP